MCICDIFSCFVNSYIHYIDLYIFFITERYQQFLVHLTFFFTLVAIFFNVLILLSTSVKKQIECLFQVEYQIEQNVSSYHVLDFTSIYRTPDQIQSFVRLHTIQPHDIIFISLIIWIFLLIYSYSNIFNSTPKPKVITQENILGQEFEANEESITYSQPLNQNDLHEEDKEEEEKQNFEEAHSDYSHNSSTTQNEIDLNVISDHSQETKPKEFEEKINNIKSEHSQEKDVKQREEIESESSPLKIEQQETPYIDNKKGRIYVPKRIHPMDIHEEKVYRLDESYVNNEKQKQNKNKAQNDKKYFLKKQNDKMYITPSKFKQSWHNQFADTSLNPNSTLSPRRNRTKQNQSSKTLQRISFSFSSSSDSHSYYDDSDY